MVRINIKKIVRFSIVVALRIIAAIFTVIGKLVSFLPMENFSRPLRKKFSRVYFELGRFQNKSRLYPQSVKSFEKSAQIQAAEIDEKLIVFDAYQGRGYACSPKALYEYMLQHDEYNTYSFVWVFRNPAKYEFLLQNPRTKVVTYNSWEAIQYFRQAKYWIVNFRVPPAIVKRPGQVMLQCWHGTPYKRIGLDIHASRKGAFSPLEKVSFEYKLDAKKHDYFISPSEFATEKFISAFNLKNLGKEDIVLEVGYPRNDFLFNHTKNDVEQIKRRLHIPFEKKVILYAPTWRDDQHALVGGYIFNPTIDFAKFADSLSDSYVILYRTHYLVNSSSDLSRYQGFVIDVSDVDDINDLYIVSDFLITDYSSVFFDFANLKRPILFYMYDYENYKNNLRDFYLTLDELPGPVVRDEDALLDTIKDLRHTSQSWSRKLDEFNKRFNYLDDGKASERVLVRMLGDRA